MSKTIEQNVVEMQFDNKNFETNTKTSMSTLEKLKQSLNLSGASKGLENVSDAAKKCDMSGLNGAVQTIQAKFSSLEVMAVTALANITNSAINAGKQIISALMIEPITEGFSEYELKMGSIQTIMAGTGESLKTVNEYLDELNIYADKTIYSFADMTSNIGKFTNAGVSLKDSVEAIQGISNVAALSGANANEASRAMYNFAQALSAGYVKLIDWKSIENANMATVEFKTQLLEAAVAAGTVEKSVDGMYRVLTTTSKGGVLKETINATMNINDSLQYQWMTTEVLVKTLGEYADETTEIGKKAFAAAQDIKTFTQLWDTLKEAAGSGWANTWEILVGDFEEAKKLLTEISTVVSSMLDASSDSRNALLSGWKDLGGRTVLIETMRKAFEGISSIITPIKDAFNEMFPAITVRQLYAFTEGLLSLAERLKIGESTSKNLKNTFKGLFAILDIVGQAFSAVFNAIKPLFPKLGELGDGILGVTGGWGEWLVNLSEIIRKTDFFNKAIQSGIDYVKRAGQAILDFARDIKERFNLPDFETIKESFKSFLGVIKEKFVFPGFEVFHTFLERVHIRMVQVGDAVGDMKSLVVTAIEYMGEALANSKFLQALEALWRGVKTIVSGLVTAFGHLTSGIIEKLSNADFKGALDIINSLIAGGIGVGLIQMLKSAKDATGGIVDILDSVRGCFEAYQTQLKAGTLIKIASAIAILAASILAISLIDSEKLAASLGAITVLFAELMGSMALFGRISGNLTGVFKTCTAMISISAAVLILASALVKIGGLEFEQMVTGLVGVVGLTAVMIGTAKAMSSSSTTIIKGATQMVIFAAAIKILASACGDLAELSWEELAKGLIGVGVLMAEISLFMNTTEFSGKSITTATGIVILAAGLKILASVCKDFAVMDWEEIGKGLTAIGGLLAEIAIFTNLTGDTNRVISTGIALIAIGAAMKIFASAIMDLSTMTWEELGRGLTGMAGALLAVTVALNFMPANMVGIGVGLIAVSAALLIMANALVKLGDMSWDEIARGLTALGGSIAILAIGLHVMNGTLAGSAALLVAATSLAILTPVLSILGAMSWESIAKGLITIAGAFTIIGLAGHILTPVMPTILGLGGAFALIGLGVVGIGVGLLAAGAGLSAIAIGFTALIAAVAGGATALVAALTVIITGVASLIPMIIEKIGEGLIALLVVIAEGAPAIGEAVKAVVLSLISVLVECVPALAHGVLEILAGLLAALVEYTPQIVDSIFQFLIEILNGVARNLPDLIQAAVGVLMSLFEGVVAALSSIDTEVLIKGIAGIGILAAIIAALAAVALLVPSAMLGVLGMGIIIAELALMFSAVGMLAQLPGLNWLINEGAGLMLNIGNAIGSFIGGIVGGFMGGVSSSFPKIANDLSSFMINLQPFIDGAKRIDAATADGIKALAEVILVLTAASILEGLTSWLTGGSSMTNFGQELAEFGPLFKTYYESVKGIDGSVVEASANAAKTLAEMASILPNSGGVAGWFAGENSLSVFADELVRFGPRLKAYADSVEGLDTDVVVNSTNAAKALSEMASNLPNSGGVVGWFSGENSLSVFADELAKFGPVLKEYATSVRGLDSNIILNSTNAAKALSEMANNLPNQGGVVGWFTGDNTLSIFGVELAAFGPSLKSYADSIRGLDTNIVTNSANAAKALAELSANLPNSGGVVSWFTGNNDIDAFGTMLVSFGQSFALYYASVSGINTTQLSAVVKEFKNLVDIASGLDSVDASGMYSFSQSLAILGDTGIDGFINAFTGAASRVKEAATAMLTTFINGAIAKRSHLTATFTVLVEATLATLKGKYYDFNAVGQEVMDNIIAGIKIKDTAFSSTFMQVIGGALIAIKNKYSDFYNAGRYLVEGFAAGITAYTYLAEARAKAMAAAAAKAAAKELDEHSPSRVGYQIGDFFGLGFVNAIGNYVSKSYKAGAGMAASAKRGLSDAVSKITDVINHDIDTQPTIRPVLDLSEMKAGTSSINALFSRTQALSIGNGMSHASDTTVQNGDVASPSGGTFQFTQNNYSPKALSRIDIYRQTKNQISAMKGLVGT